MTHSAWVLRNCDVATNKDHAAFYPLAWEDACEMYLVKKKPDCKKVLCNMNIF